MLTSSLHIPESGILHFSIKREEAMTVKDLEMLFDDGYWANRKLDQSPGNFDIIFYFVEKRDVRAQ